MQNQIKVTSSTQDLQGRKQSLSLLEYHNLRLRRNLPHNKSKEEVMEILK
jgi:hypothetical protein